MNSRLEPDAPANTADQTAAEKIAVPEHTSLQPRDREVFFALLNTPSAPTEKLGTAFVHHRETITSQ